MPSSLRSAPYALSDGRLELIAIDETLNIHHRYAIELSEDLFGCHIIETAWGRVGGWTAAKRVSFQTRAEADHIVQYHLRRRATAERRIGVPYQPLPCA